MKYILTILLGCLIYSAEGQSKINKRIDSLRQALDSWTSDILQDRIDLYNRQQEEINLLGKAFREQRSHLDSLTQAFQSLHDSLIQLEREVGPWGQLFNPGTNQPRWNFDPGSDGHIIDTGRLKYFINADGDTISMRDVLYDGPIQARYNDSSIPAPKNALSDSTQLSPAPKKKRRRG